MGNTFVKRINIVLNTPHEQNPAVLGAMVVQSIINVTNMLWIRSLSCRKCDESIIFTCNVFDYVTDNTYDHCKRSKGIIMELITILAASQVNGSRL